MSAAVFLPDPLLSRVSPAADPDGFDIQALLSPAQARFARDPLLFPVEHAAESGLPGDHAAEFGANGPLLEDGSEPASGATPGPLPEAADPAPPLHAGDAPSLPPDLHALVEQRYREGYEEGMAEGARLALDEAAGGFRHEPANGDEPGATSPARDTLLLLESLSRALQPLLLPDDAAVRFEPLKRLALHLATELVRTELKVSPHVVEQLVSRSVQALQAGDEAPLTVELHPQDLALLQAAWDDPVSGLSPEVPLRNRIAWREDPQLARGSVRVRSDASTVEDLIEQRLASIMQDLRIQAPKWQEDESRLQAQLVPPSPAAADGEIGMSDA